MARAGPVGGLSSKVFALNFSVISLLNIKNIDPNKFFVHTILAQAARKRNK